MKSLNPNLSKHPNPALFAEQLALKKIAIIGLGLLGGSLAMAIKAHKIPCKIVAYDQDSQTLQKAKDAQLIDQGITKLSTAVHDADFIFLATPLATYAKLLPLIAASMRADAILSDVGSAKNQIVQLAETFLGAKFSRFVPGHPIAGSEKSGWENANAQLFVDRTVILTPTAATDATALQTMHDFWQQLGAHVKLMPPLMHDEILAVTSHLPQLLAYVFMQYVAKHSHYPELLNDTGCGFSDFTRLAQSDPTMWQSICLANRETLLQEIKNFQLQLNQLQQALTQTDSEFLQNYFAQAQSIKQSSLKLPTLKPTKD